MDRKRKRNKKTVVRSRCREAKRTDGGKVDNLYSLNFLLAFLGISVMLAGCAKSLAC